MRLAAALVTASLAALGVGCQHAPERVFSIYDVIGNIDALNGQTVRVGGFLPSCGGYECILFKNADEARRFNEWLVTIRKNPDPPYEPPEFLGIGSDGDFDSKAAPFIGQYVLITGTVDNSCRDDQGKWGCTDRGPEIHPKSIEAWRLPRPEAGRAPEKKA